MKRIAILQSNYVPWKGYFDLIRSVDEFILYDSAQYTKNDWRNRNQIKSPAGKLWLTLPVRRTRSDQPIDQVLLSDSRVLRKHLETFRQNYARARSIEYADAMLRPLFEQALHLDKLSELNELFLRGICTLLGIKTSITRSTDYDLSCAGGRTERLLQLCIQTGAKEYLTGPAASHYLDQSMFDAAGIHLLWADYSGYPEYDQPHPPFDHHVSIIDLIACTGEQASDYMSEVTQ